MTAAFFRPAAAADVENAYRWYERQRDGLGSELLAATGEEGEGATAFPVIQLGAQQDIILLSDVLAQLARHIDRVPVGVIVFEEQKATEVHANVGLLGTALRGTGP